MMGQVHRIFSLICFHQDLIYSAHYQKLKATRKRLEKSNLLQVEKDGKHDRQRHIATESQKVTNEI